MHPAVTRAAKRKRRNRIIGWSYLPLFDVPLIRTPEHISFAGVVSSITICGAINPTPTSPGGSKWQQSRMVK
jgi:hypothetical protein